ncbi:uncharacterized protein Z520_11659 [Fonsecaea multimorphosa CBS 102226]|uniref:WW domain-containing protein n=1 Tax=Fonsecaea multimorphosa CBS 102226 TaxID=1442371 RepID=A0A0D2GT25_9EURO|nr:uncharacterized protein Z520_11659 [Fonsecaea multimorphosa CBS 102226]KIX92630.1 hypothetical protein Z520_11659 [Fonsecaea multimorphosa CBS 102226]OAL17853.1 hypothetical protein AYO22_11197 [Fonsecaea multimorphosa]
MSQQFFSKAGTRLTPGLYFVPSSLYNIPGVKISAAACEMSSKLKSTYRSVPVEPPLPPGWTEHKAPTGHTYYYNAETKQSTYTRPSLPSDEPLRIDYGASEPDHVMRASLQAMEEFNKNNAMAQAGHFTGGRSYQEHSRPRRNHGDRPKSKAPIPNCAPWVLVKTKLGRRFVHNTETKQSLWKFPQDVMMAVIEMDRLEWEAKKKAGTEQQESNEDRGKSQPRVDTPRPDTPTRDRSRASVGPEEYDSDEYEEVEVTDDEAEADDEPSKRPRLSHDAESENPPPAGPVEFDEDDIAWQLAQMEGDDGYGEDRDYTRGDGEREEEDEDEDEDEGLPLTAEDNIALFRSLLDDSGISPYSTFEKLIEDTTLIEDPRYVALPNTSSRKEAFVAWSKDRIAELQALKASAAAANTQNKKDPRVEYLRFLQNHATPKLYWPEFRRKFKKSPEMLERSMQDKEREKLYRELVGKLKLGDAERRKEVVGLLKSVDKTKFDPASDSPDALPDAILRDVRFYILDPARRDELVRTFLETL